MDIAAANPGAAAGLDSYDASKLASERFQERYSVEGMTERAEELGDEEKALLEEKGELADQLKTAPTKTKDDVKKARALKAQVTAKQAEIDAKIKARKALEKEIKRFEALDKAVADLEAAIAKLEGEIETLNQDVEKLEKGESLDPAKAPLTGKALTKEIKARKGQIALKAAAIKKQQGKLAKAVATREDDTMRGYASRGFLDLDKTLVEELKKAGLGWGGDYKGAKDFMHFEVK
jgi:chromosome segregation ATPase